MTLGHSSLSVSNIVKNNQVDPSGSLTRRSGEVHAVLCVGVNVNSAGVDVAFIAGKCELRTKENITFKLNITSNTILSPGQQTVSQGAVKWAQPQLLYAF